MSDAFTPKLHLVKPDVGASDDTWGEKLNSNFDKIDAASITDSVDKDYVDTENALQDAAIEGKVDISGDLMTGFLTLHADPTTAMHAATRQFVLANAGSGGGGVSQSYVDTADALRVLKAGDTMTGHLFLPTAPASANAVRKDYVDTADALKADKTYVDTQDGLKVAKTGDIMTGALSLNYGDPTLVMSKSNDAANVCQFNIHTGALLRWQIRPSDINNYFNLHRYNAGGAYVDTPLSINWNTGGMTLPNTLNVGGRLTAEIASPGIQLALKDTTSGTSKYLRNNANILEYVNNTNTIVIADLSDTGSFSAKGGVRSDNDITTSRSAGPTTGAYYFGASNGGTKYLFYDGTKFTLNGGSITVPKIIVNVDSGFPAPVIVTTPGGVSAHGVSILEQAGAGTYFVTFYNNAASLIGYIHQATPTSVVYSTTSDDRLKTEKRPVREVLDIRAAVMGVEVIEFGWDGYKHREIGLSAQQAYPHMPRMVVPGNDLGPKDKGFQPWGISYADAAPYLIAASQDHYTVIEALNNRIKTLEERLQTLEAKGTTNG